MTSTILEIIIILLFSAFFSGMETAFISSDKLRAELNRNDESLSSRILAVFYSHPNDFIATLLVGNYIALVVYALLMAGIVDDYVLSRLQTDLPAGIDILLQVAAASLISLATVEFIPKNVFKMAPNRMLRICALPSFAAYILLLSRWPSWPASCPGLAARAGTQGEQERVGTGLHQDRLGQPDTVEHRIDARRGRSDGRNQDFPERPLLLGSESQGLHGATHGNRSHRNRRLHRVAEKPLHRKRKSKIIVYKEDIDHIVGFIHSSEMFRNPADWTTRIIETPVVPETMSAQNLLKKFMQQKKSLAIVVDEFGGTSGIVTMEDLVEEIFGDIEDEHDNTHYVAQKVGEHEYVLSGRLEVEKANELLGLDLPESEDYVTVSGLILHRYQSFPKLNEIVKFDHFEFKIIKNTTTKIELVRLKTTE